MIDQAVSRRLQHAGQRYTSSRRAIVAALAAAPHPLSIPEIVAARDDLAVSSVYRNLTVLEDAGVVHRIDTSHEFKRYELADGLTEHHHHLICSGCGRVEDFTASPSLERTTERTLAGVAGAAGFTMHGHRIDLVGLCRDCA